MTTPTEKWQLKLLKLFFGPELIVRAYTATHLYQQSSKLKQLKPAEQSITDVILKNTGIGLLCGIASIALLQRAFPTYGSGFSFTNFIIDGGVFMLFTGGATLYSLQEIEPIIQPIRKKWILEHNLEYLRKMRELQKTFQIGLLFQIEKYVPADDRLGWKDKYDGVLLS